MPYLKSKTRPLKYDKTSIEFRKEYERLSKKSKGEYEILENNDKAELFLSEGVPAKKPLPKIKEFTRESKSSNTSSDKKTCQQVMKEDLAHATKTKPRSPQASGKSTKGVRLRKTEDLKTKPRLHEQGVASIRADNPDLKVVMQGKKIKKNLGDEGDTQAEEDRVMTKYSITLVHYTFTQSH